MKNYAGMKWMELTIEEQGALLVSANAVDGKTGNEMKEDGECIVDLTEDLSVAGEMLDGEITVKNESIIYNPTEGVKAWRTPQERWQAKVGLISKSYKLPKTIVNDFAKACDKAGTTQAKQLKTMMIDFIEKNK